MTVKLLTEHYLAFLSLYEVVPACLSLHLSKCHIVRNHMLWLNYGSNCNANKHICSILP